MSKSLHIFNCLLKHMTNAGEGHLEYVAPLSVFNLPLPLIPCTLSLTAPLVTTWPLSGASGARRLN